MPKLMNATFVIPVFNEEKTIGAVIKKCKKLKCKILVVDNGSTDATPTIVKSMKVPIIYECRRGKGFAFRKALSFVNTEWVILIDGDGTYDPAEIANLLSKAKDADMVIGSRTSIKNIGSFKILNYFGNIMITTLASIFFFHKFNDILSGGRCMKLNMLRDLNLKSKGFEIETEVTLKAIKKGYKIKEFPINYALRKTSSKLSSIIDGFKIITEIFKQRFALV